MPARFAYAISKRLGSRDQRWRYYMHLATQVKAGRWARGAITTARRNRRVRHRAKAAS